ncbi:MAG: beta-glucosidase [Ferruginibacter sp.]|nr:beta-glucosidase [Cytophagales bacterium]
MERSVPQYLPPNPYAKSSLNLPETTASRPPLVSSVEFDAIHDQASSPALKRDDFGRDFVWGASTAAYQIEGAHKGYGKGESIWDAFSRMPGKIKDRSTGDVACDFYHRFPQDLALLRFLNLGAFRFSLSWSRLFPQGRGPINQQGVAFYQRVIDACLALGIQPWVTLYHWDLPQALENQGGWANRDVLGWFAEYVDFATRTYGDRVKHWMVLNEPTVFTAAGYMLGIHAPGRWGFNNFLPAAHHAALCQAEGGRIAKANVPDAEIGTTLSFTPIEPCDENKPRHVAAAGRLDAVYNRFFLEASLGMGYPYETVSGLRDVDRYFREGDEQRLPFDFDFIGVQNYTRELASFSPLNPLVWAEPVPAEKRGVDTTAMKWEVYPEGLYQILKKVSRYPGVKKVYVTENGAAFPDTVQNGRVVDARRVQFFHDYLAQVRRAKREGAKVDGYFAWSLMDNFEWAEGYQPRFGLVHVDFQTQQRIVKESGHWFRQFLRVDA